MKRFSERYQLFPWRAMNDAEPAFTSFWQLAQIHNMLSAAECAGHGLRTLHLESFFVH